MLSCQEVVEAVRLSLEHQHTEELRSYVRHCEEHRSNKDRYCPLITTILPPDHVICVDAFEFLVRNELSRRGIEELAR